MQIGFFPSLFDHPQRLKFSEQEVDEVIELFLRQHWVTNVPWILGSLIAFVTPAVLLFLDQLFSTNYFAVIPLEISIGGIIVWYMLIMAYVLESFLFWYFNVYIVTNKHLVDINFYNLLNRQILEVKLVNVEGVFSKISGFIGSLFNYGDVVARTAAEKQEITFDRVPNPDYVTDRIQDLGSYLPHKKGNNP